MVDPFIAVIISVPVILLMLAVGIPVFVVLGLTGFLGCAMVSDWNQALLSLKTFPYTTTASYLMVVVPLFIIMGHFAFKAGIGRDIFTIGRLWLSRLPAGLGLAAILGSGGFAACSGSSVATAATLGAVAVPEMRKHGYDPGLACGIVAAGGVLGIMIPPSVILVVYGALTDTSVGALLIAGILPGILGMLVYMIGLLFLSRFIPNLAPDTEKFSWRQRFASLRYGLSAAILFVTVIGGIYIGWFSPTEAAAVGAFIALAVLLIRRKGLIGETLPEALVDCFKQTVNTTCMVFIVLVGAGIYSFFLTLAQVPQMIALWVSSLSIPPLMVVFGFLIILLVLGMFLDSFSLLLVTMPIMFPVVVFQLGYHPIWFGILATQSCSIGLITPPVGLNVYVLAGVVKDVSLTKIFHGCMWFTLFATITLLILFFFPEISLILPKTMGRG
ncbi:MAG: TRAP transporter large permease [Syntrophales bacterium]|jgi:tripartite ATP-independent transporter DctM subunit|nr:TRAP transporter large permease [Syntrophales bacterium]MDX9922005.1 TRAP transporter large permease [Syntrophales bacterium]